jgi:hypothetical protein
MISRFHPMAQRGSLIVSIAVGALLALPPAAALADRGGGSIRAAGRGEPARAEAPRGEAGHGQPARGEPARAEPARNEPARGGPERVDHAAPREPAHAEPVRPAPEVRHDERRPAPPPPRVEVRDHRDWDDHDVEVAHGGGFAHGEHVRIIRGQRFHDLPHHIVVPFNNVSYYYDDDGNFYLPQNGEYVDVQPPVGAIVPALPPGAIAVVAGPTTYYYLDGVFYVAQNNAFAVVNPPPGIVVPELPDGANQVVVNGNVLYQFNGLNYQPSIQDGVTVYTVTPM